MYTHFDVPFSPLSSPPPLALPRDQLSSIKRELDLKSTQLIWECRKLTEAEARLHKCEKDKAVMLNQTCAMKLKLQEALDKQEHGMCIFSVYSVMYTVLYSMYIMYTVLYSMYIMYTVLYSMYIMYTVLYSMYIMYNVLYSMYIILYSVCIMYCIVCILYCIVCV